jgi:hypothetical protein
MSSRRRRRALVPLILGAGVALLAIGVSGLGGGGGEARAETTDAFRDVASRRGLSTTQPAVGSCGFNAAGAAWGDVEGDGDLDLFLPRQQGGSQLWLQGPSGGFDEGAGEAGLRELGVATAAAFADYDNDGDVDLYVGAAGPDQLLDNDGSGSFEPRPLHLTPSSDPLAPGGLVAGGAAPTTAVSWSDFDGDGNLDLLATRGGNCEDEPAPAQNQLYRGLGDGRFEDASRLLPEQPSGGVTLDAVWFDADADGAQELYLGNDDLNDRANALLTPGTSASSRFEDLSAASGAGISRFTMGVAAGDLDGNELPDLVATDIGREALLLQTAPGRFAERAEQLGFGRELAHDDSPSITWGVALADFDNDADLDVYTAGGALGRDSDAQDDALYVNDGSGAFEQRRVPAPGSGRVVAPADWDRDGDVDLLVAQLGAQPLLLENRAPAARHWLELTLVGKSSARQACGAVVTLRAGGERQWRSVDCRSGEPTLHFGLGEARRARSLQVRWPSGLLQEIDSRRADRRHLIDEPR